jgi:monoamine oxidase
MQMLKRVTRQVALERRLAEGAAVPPKAEAATLSRRDVLFGAAATGAAMLFPLPGLAQEATIAIVGAGLAGLAAAHRLRTRYGLNAHVYEGNTRVGGRCFTARGIFAQNQIAEHGGELIDTDQVAIQRLAAELGLTLTDVLAAVPPGTKALYRFNDQPYDLADATRDWRPIHDLVKQQSNRIGDFGFPNRPTDAAKRFDAMTISEWVGRYIPGGRRSQLGQLIENAFTEENALDADEQSALCAIPTLADNPRNNFQLYYVDSDQHYHITGGNDQIATIIANQLGARLHTATALIAIRRLPSGRIRLTFAQSSGTFDRDFDRVILTIPFSVMRVAVDFSQAGFRPRKVRAINELAMGVSCKTQLQFMRRKWYDVGCNSEIRLPAVAFDTTWDVTRGQPGQAGIFNFFAGGTQSIRAGEIDDNSLALLLMREAAPLIPGLSGLWNGLMIKNAWQFNPWSYGSYSTYRPGYQTTLLGIERLPEGNCFFAGEHTADENGFLNSAVQTGNRAAREVAESLSSPPPSGNLAEH